MYTFKEIRMTTTAVVTRYPINSESVIALRNFPVTTRKNRAKLQPASTMNTMTTTCCAYVNDASDEFNGLKPPVASVPNEIRKDL